jgi:hypothetical protein
LLGIQKRSGWLVWLEALAVYRHKYGTEHMEKIPYLALQNDAIPYLAPKDKSSPI